MSRPRTRVNSESSPLLINQAADERYESAGLRPGADRWSRLTLRADDPRFYTSLGGGGERSDGCCGTSCCAGCCARLAPLSEPLFGVRRGEGLLTFLLCLNVFICLFGYYVLKTIREPLILQEPDGPALKTYATAFQAGVLMFMVPFYSWLTTRLRPLKLVAVCNVTLILLIEAFSVIEFTSASLSQTLHIGFAFYIFVGIYGLFSVSQFWSFVADTLSSDAAKRLVPTIMLGASTGIVLGSYATAALLPVFQGLATDHFPGNPDAAFFIMAQITVVFMIVQVAIYVGVSRVSEGGALEVSSSRGGLCGGFRFIFRSGYLRTLVVMVLLMALVSQLDDYILANFVTEDCEATASETGIAPTDCLGAFYGQFYAIVGFGALLLQGVLAMPLSKYGGMAALLAAPALVEAGVATTALVGTVLVVYKWLKVLSYSTDYSVWNTANVMIWTVTSRDEKYAAKQTVDTFCVRAGDMVAAAVVFAGQNWLKFEIRDFAIVCAVAVVGWGITGVVLNRFYRKKRTEAAENDVAGGEDADFDEDMTEWMMVNVFGGDGGQFGFFPENLDLLNAHDTVRRRRSRSLSNPVNNSRDGRGNGRDRVATLPPATFGSMGSSAGSGGGGGGSGTAEGGARPRASDSGYGEI